MDRLALARAAIAAELESLQALRLDDSFESLIEACLNCRGNIVLSGSGKSAFIAQKTAASMASFGRKAWFMHAADAEHGDLGKLIADDLIIVFSKSGETRECVALAEAANIRGLSVASVTCRPNSRLAKASKHVVNLGPLSEADTIVGAPTTSTTAMLLVGDALALSTSEVTVEDFYKNHPGGMIGLRLSKVETVMRPKSECAILELHEPLKEVIIAVTEARAGAAMIVCCGVLHGFISDGDLRRFIRAHPIDNSYASDCMIRDPLTIRPDVLVEEAMEIFKNRAIGELPVVDGDNRPIGMLSLKDLAKLIL